MGKGRATATADGLRLLIHTDGAARGNPGPAGAGAALRDAADGSLVSELAVFLGRRTNNYAEWTAVALALEEAKLLGASRVDLRMDSQLVARQISGMYRVKHPDLKPIHAQVMELLAGFDGYTVGHVPRELNKEADRLSNVAIDRRGTEPSESRIELGSLEAAGRPRAHRSKGRVRGKSELHRAGSRVTPVRREARNSATVTMPASAGVKRGKLEPEQDRIGGREAARSALG